MFSLKNCNYYLFIKKNTVSTRPYIIIIDIFIGFALTLISLVKINFYGYNMVVSVAIFLFFI